MLLVFLILVFATNNTTCNRNHKHWSCVNYLSKVKVVVKVQAFGNEYDVDSITAKAKKLAGKDVSVYIKPEDGKDYIQIYGRQNNERLFKWIRRDYIDSHDNLDYYKVLVAKSNGSGAFGEALTSPVVGLPGQGHTQTFISIGKFETIEEAEACLKYIKTKMLPSL